MADTTNVALKRDVGFLGLIFASEGSIIGSGWLFGALYASQLAGGGAILSWIIGAVAVLILSLVHAELGGMYPVSGGTARYPHYSYGGLVGFSFGWFSWLQAVTVAPIEVEAAIQYATNYIPSLTKVSGGVTVLTPEGYVVAVALMGVFTVINIFGIRKLATVNNAATWWKIIVPVLTIVVLFAVRFHTGNFTAAAGHEHGFLPFGIKGVFVAVSNGGVIFALLGFEQAVQIGGESSHPQRDTPRAVIGSIIIGIVVYLLLQLVFVGALQPSNLSKGWENLSFSGLFGPFAGLAKNLGLGWLAVLLYIDAIISPGGTGLIYQTSTSRLSYGLARNGYIPVAFEKTNPKTGVPTFSVVFAFLVGLLLFLPFPGWQKLVGFITSASALMYAGAPLALGALRHQEPDRKRPYRMPLHSVMTPLAFVVANLIIYWSGWTVDWKLYIAVLLGFGLLALSIATKANPAAPRLDWKASQWLWPYLGGMALISYLGQFGGGTNFIPFWWDMAVVTAWSLVIYYWAISVRLSTEDERALVDEVELVTLEEH